MNLSTARSGKRAKEVGIRKVVGAERWSLVYQFIGESAMMSILALALALLMAYTLLPFFNELTQKNLQLDAPTTVVVDCGSHNMFGDHFGILSCLLFIIF